jgi:glutamate-1-semialdehyde 2,1-aminomutase
MTLVADASTQSRANRPLPEGWKPKVIRRGGVSEIWDLGNRLHGIECTWTLSQGGELLGYTSRHSKYSRPIMAELDRAIKDGMLGPGSVASKLEYEVADLLCEILSPYLTDCEGDLAVRWFANGSDSCDCAVRLARAATGRNKYISIGYHGSSVIFAHPPQNKGVPKYITQDKTDVEWGDMQGLRDAFADKIACIIVEVPSDDSKAVDFLLECRSLCYEHEAVLIFDELVTGFRLALGGAAEHYQVVPDLACYGKAMANGRGISALVGWPRIMGQLQDKVFYSNTFNGDPLNLAFTLGTLKYLQKWEDAVYPQIWETGEKLRIALEDAGLKMIGHAPRMDMKWTSNKARREFCIGMVKQKIVCDRPFYVSLAHTDRHIEMTAAATRKVLGK